MSHLAMVAGLGRDEPDDGPTEIPLEPMIDPIEEELEELAAIGWTEPATRPRRIDLERVELLPPYPELPPTLEGLERQAIAHRRRPFDQDVDR